MRAFPRSTLLFVVSLCLFLYGTLRADGYPDPARYESAIAKFEEVAARNPPPEGAIVCIGSSSMRMWKGIHEDLAPLTVIHRGFGGSNMNDALHFADRIVIPYRPRAVVVYEGDNDIAAGIPPAKILETFRAFVDKLHAELPDCRIYFLSIKPSIRRWSLWPKMEEANQLLEDFCISRDGLTYVDVATPMLDADGTPRTDIFKGDKLHMNEAGYELWREALRPVLMEREAAAQPVE